MATAWRAVHPDDLRGADLRYANLGGADLGGATANERTTWPAGFDPDAAGVLR